MKRLWCALASIRFTALLLVLLALLLLASVLLPFARDIATSPAFLTLLALFFANLIAVLIDRTPQTFAKMRVRVPAADAAAKWLASPRAIARVAAQPLDARDIVTLLRGFGFRPYRVYGNVLYGVKHRRAALGFLVFHLSFFFLCAGGTAIWYTRSVRVLRVVEGQSAEAKDAKALRVPPTGVAPNLALTLQSLQPSFENGEATDLRATLRFANRAGATQAWVNHPARLGTTSVLVSDAGLAPVFWLQDVRGFGVDRVAVPATRKSNEPVPLAGGLVTVRVLQSMPGGAFPHDLANAPIEIAVMENGAEVFRGVLKPGEAAPLRGGRLVLAEVRRWAGLQIVHERGGALLILGFVLATLGAIWRMLLHRRDVVVAWDGHTFRIAGHGEWFVENDRAELAKLAATLEDARATGWRVAEASS